MEKTLHITQYLLVEVDYDTYTKHSSHPNINDNKMQFILEPSMNKYAPD